MNPLTNRWAALGLVALVLLAVAELVGTDEQAGVLAQAAGTQAPDGVEQGMEAPLGGIEIIEGEETPEEDLPQLIREDSPEIIENDEVIDGSDDQQEIAEVMGQDEFVEESDDSVEE